MHHHRYPEEVMTDGRRRRLQEAFCRLCSDRNNTYCLQQCFLAEKNPYHGMPQRPILRKTASQEVA